MTRFNNGYWRWALCKRREKTENFCFWVLTEVIILSSLFFKNLASNSLVLFLHFKNTYFFSWKNFILSQGMKYELFMRIFQVRDIAFFFICVLHQPWKMNDRISLKRLQITSNNDFFLSLPFWKMKWNDRKMIIHAK